MKATLRHSNMMMAGALFASCIACSSADQNTFDKPGKPTSTEEKVESLPENPPPLLQVDVEPGHTISFYEPSPGNLFMVESRTRSQRSVTNQMGQQGEVDFIEVFSRVQPDKEVPTVLLDAYARAQANQGTLDTTVHEEPAGTVGAQGEYVGPSEGEALGNGVGVLRQAHSTSDAAHFVNDHGGCNWAPIYSRCNLNWFNGYHSGSVTSQTASSTVDHFSGNGITVGFAAGGSFQSFTHHVNVVQDVTWGVRSGNLRRFLEISNATNDGFHVGVRWH